MKEINPSEFRSHFSYKYIRFDDGSIVFFGLSDNHSDMAKFMNKLPVSAGKIKVLRNNFSVCEKGSFTLKIDWTEWKESDVELLGNILRDFGYTEGNTDY